MKVYGVIPARAGSRGVPGKNFKEVAGEHLVGYTLQSIQGTQLDKCFVSTDDPRIIEYTKEHYPEIQVPFTRPSELAEDDTEAIWVALHILDYLESIQDVPDYLCWLQPTSPLRTSSFINLCLSQVQEGIDSIISVRQAGSEHPYKAKAVTEDGFLTPFIQNASSKTNRQALPPCFVPDGCVYITSVKTLREQRNFFGKRSKPVVTPIEESQDIDTPFDVYVAELLLIDRKTLE